VPDHLSDEVATLTVTAGTAMYGLDVLGGLIAGQSIVICGGGPVGLMFVALAKALGAATVMLSEPRPERREMAKKLGADFVIDPVSADPVAKVRELTGGKGAHYTVEASGVPTVINQVIHMTHRGGRICLAAFFQNPIPTDIGYVVSNNIYMFGIRGEGAGAVKRAAALLQLKRFDPSPIHTHTFPMEETPKAMSYAENQTDGAIKVVVKMT
jgi:L-iditol 2-dehydrogenase